MRNCVYVQFQPSNTVVLLLRISRGTLYALDSVFTDERKLMQSDVMLVFILRLNAHQVREVVL